MVWRLVSADGHPIGGSLSFSSAPRATSSTSRRPATATPTHPSCWACCAGWRYLGLLVAAGVAAFAALFLPAEGVEAERGRLRRTARRAAAVAVPTWWAAVPLVALYQLGLPASSLADGSTWSALAAWEYVVPAAVTVGLALAAFSRPGLALVGCLVALAAPSLTGHTRATTPQALVIAVDVLHLVAGALWSGRARRARPRAADPGRPGRVRRGRAGPVPPPGRRASWRCSSSPVSVMAWRVAGSWSALFDTTYGTLLIVKVLGRPGGDRDRGLEPVRASCRACARRRAPRARRRGGPPGAARRRRGGALVAVLLVTGFLVDRSPEPEVSVSAAASSGSGATVSSTRSRRTSRSTRSASDRSRSP